MIIPDYISHYYYPDKKPFLNLSELREEERFLVIHELNLRKEKDETLREFPDWYMPQRIEAETKLKDLFLNKGGQTEKIAPHYFTLGTSPVLEFLYKCNFKTIKIPVADFTESELCFCINDSLWTMAESRKLGIKFNNRWFEGQVYSYKEVCEIVQQLEMDVDNMESLKKHKINYIEALVWTDKILK